MSRRRAEGATRLPPALDSGVADRIIQLLETGTADADTWRQRLSELETRFGRQVYSVLLFVLTQLDFAADKARDHWEHVLREWQTLDGVVPGGVDLRVALLQYFLRGERKLKNPALVEIRLLRRTQESAMYDELTRLHNYRYFQDRLAAETRRAERYTSPLTLLMVDLDGFKDFNDGRGHLAGNLALRRLAAVLKRSVRAVDVVARYGGEEFAILLPSTPKLAGLKVAEKTRQAVERARIGRDEGDSRRGLTVSIGVATLPGDASSPGELVDRADRALYLAKSVGKNCVLPFSDERRDHSRFDAVLPGLYLPAEGEAHPLTTLNVSEGGVLFHSQEPLATGAVVRVRLDLPPAGEPVECIVRVLRVMGARAGFEMATQIEHMGQQHERRYRHFLKALAAGERASAPLESDPGPTSDRTRELVTS